MCLHAGSKLELNTALSVLPPTLNSLRKIAGATESLLGNKPCGERIRNVIKLLSGIGKRRRNQVHAPKEEELGFIRANLIMYGIIKLLI